MTTAAIIALLAIVALVTVILVVRGGHSSDEGPATPPAMRGGYDDQTLENQITFRVRWAIVLLMFFLALFLPIYWLFESGRLTSSAQQTFISSVERGAVLYEENCASCHGAEGGGGAAASPYSDETWPAPNLTNIAARYEDNDNVGDIRDFIVTVLERGRPGSPMPTWGREYGGPLTAGEISDITDWILANQVAESASAQSTSVSGEELYTANCAKCHGPDGRAESDAGPRPGPSLVGLFERHNAETVLGILRNGIYLENGTNMPPWQKGYTYPGENGEGTAYDDEALRSIVEHLRTLQPEQLPPGSDQYQVPGSGTEDGASASPEASEPQQARAGPGTQPSIAPHAAARGADPAAGASSALLARPGVGQPEAAGGSP